MHELAADTVLSVQSVSIAYATEATLAVERTYPIIRGFALMLGFSPQAPGDRPKNRLD